MADQLLLEGTTTLELSAKGAGSDVRSWARGKVGREGARLFINNIRQPGNVDTIINRNRGSVGIGTSSPTAKLTVDSGDARPAIKARNGVGDGIRGESGSGHGVSGASNSHTGTEGASNSGTGVHGLSSSGTGVRGESGNGTGVVGQTNGGLFIFEGRDFNNLRFAVRRDGAVLADGPFFGPADFAEMLPAEGPVSEYEPGDVLVIGTAGKLVKATEPQATNLAGVYSGDPGFVGDMRIRKYGLTEFEEAHSEIAEETWLPVALLGVVPVKASAESGPIRPGDLLVSAKTPGHAMRAEPMQISGVKIYPTGAILGKALEPLESGFALIMVLVMPR